MGYSLGFWAVFFTITVSLTLTLITPLKSYPNSNHDPKQILTLTPWAKTIKKNTNSTQNKSQTHRAKQYEVTSFMSSQIVS